MLKTRIITGLVLGALTAAVIIYGSTWVVAVFFGSLVMVGAWEWSCLSRLTYPTRMVFMAVMLLMLIAGWSQLSTAAMPLLISLGVGWWIIALIWLSLMTDGVPKDIWIARVFTPLGYSVLIPAWLAIVYLHAQDPNLLVFVLLLVIIADTAAYFAGRRYGRTPLAPQISPKKTREGLWGAIIAGGAFALLASAWLELPTVKWPYFFGLSLVAVLFSVVGDLFESLVKRHAGVKDSGQFLPGHGGVLDRIDGVTAALPVFVLGLQWL